MRFADRTVVVCLLVGGFGASAFAAPMTVKSNHYPAPIRSSGRTQECLWLTPQGMLVLEVSGPTNIGLGVRELLAEKETLPPVDLTVVRDDVEQGTVRFRLPEPDGSVFVDRAEIRPSGEVLVKIEVPAGRHVYRLLVNGPSHGIAVRPFLGPVLGGEAIVATPGKAVSAEVLAPPARIVEKAKGLGSDQKLARPPLQVPTPEIVPPVVAVAAGRKSMAVFEPAIRSGPEKLGKGTRISGSLAGVLLVGGTSVLVSATLLRDRAMREPVQLPAGEMFERSQRTYQAASILYGFAGAALLATLIAYLVEEPESFVDASFRPPIAPLAIRF